jgi:hypothetical protein
MPPLRLIRARRRGCVAVLIFSDRSIGRFSLFSGGIAGKAGNTTRKE